MRRTKQHMLIGLYHQSVDPLDSIDFAHPVVGAKIENCYLFLSDWTTTG